MITWCVDENGDKLSIKLRIPYFNQTQIVHLHMSISLHFVTKCIYTLQYHAANL
jgi:hypothetical protein